MKRIVFDIDGTLCEERETFERGLAQPKKEIIELVNEVYAQGVFVILYTARSWSEYRITETWLKGNGVHYNLLMCGKPVYDLWVDDRSVNPNNIEKLKEEIRGRHVRNLG